jgi:hypothetical protein
VRTAQAAVSVLAATKLSAVGYKNITVTALKKFSFITT